MVLSLRTKQCLMALGGVLGAIFLAAAYYGYELTRKEDPGLLLGANSSDAKEATRKLKLLADAQASGKRGFVRLSELEINSFLNSEYNNDNPGVTNRLLQAVTVRGSVDLSRKVLVWYTVVRKPLLGGKWLDFLWERTVAIDHDKGKWSVQVHSMRVGDVEIPARLWATVDRFFQGADQKFDDRMKWLITLPALELTLNELSLLPELRLYNYDPKLTAKP